MDLLQVASTVIGALLVSSFAAALAGRFMLGTIYPLCAVLCAILLAVNATELFSPDIGAAITLPLGLPQIGVHLRLDVLSAFFGIVVNLGGMSASIYGIGYGRHEQHPLRILPFYPAFLAGMNLVLIADDAFTFLFAWEFMSLVSWALVVSHHREQANRYAGYIYLLMANLGTLALLFAFGMLAGSSGGYAFDTMRALERPAWIAAFALTMTLIGAGSKAGIVPLHVWLPFAHPAAPSHVSALLSGVMTKVAVYGFVRMVFDLLGPLEWWWGIVVLTLGGVTAVLGVLYALMQHDLKRLLAYHTVENIGIIFIGLGLALAFKANHVTEVAALAFTAALFHVFNHSIFKSLLFFGAGAVLTATGERDMERLGGLIHRMPGTAIAFLIGCAAISALPPLNGFVSEWLTFQAILLGPQLPQWGLKFAVPMVGAMLALSAALAAACFVKAFGITFLGRPRTVAAEAAQETDRWSLTAMYSLAFLCLVAGTLPNLFIDSLAPVVSSIIGGRMPLQTVLPWLSVVPTTESHSSYNGLLTFFFITLSALIAAGIIHRAASKVVRPGPLWDCGYPELGPTMQYSASSFAQPIRRIFGTIIFHARERVEMPLPGEARPARLWVELRDLVWDALYAPVADFVAFVADRLNHLQSLTIRGYLVLMFFALIILLMVVALWHS